jgi:hypothetical protein
MAEVDEERRFRSRNRRSDAEMMVVVEATEQAAAAAAAAAAAVVFREICAGGGDGRGSGAGLRLGWQFINGAVLLGLRSVWAYATYAIPYGVQLQLQRVLPSSL